MENIKTMSVDKFKNRSKVTCFVKNAGLVLILFALCMKGLFSVQASSVSDNASSETAIDESSGDTLTEDGHVVNELQAQSQKEESIQTNDIEGWPEGPAITAEAAILMDADTGTLLYAKNIDETMYPASTTKLLTCLLSVEYLNLNDSITFSETAISAVPSDGSNIGMSVGETITVEQCLYGLMVGSGNECANALAEAVSGSIEAFVDLMNQRAEELGCTGTNFVNANGLYDDNHYTTAYDLAIIAKAFFDNEICLEIGNCASYHFEATDAQPDDFTLTNKHELITGEVTYNGIIGGKTGYTSQSHENLVTGCEQGDVRLICVVMLEDDPAQFDDTVTLLDYGYENFSKLSVTDYESMPATDVSSYLTMGTDLLGSSVSALSISEGGYINLPNTADFEDVTAIYASDNTITYYFDGMDGIKIGSANLEPINLSENGIVTIASQAKVQEEEQKNNYIMDIISMYVTVGMNGTTYINVSMFLITIICVSVLLIIYFQFRSAMQEAKERAKKRRQRVRRSHVERNDYYENHRYDRPDQYYSDEYGTNLSGDYYSSNNYRDDYYGNTNYTDDDWY